MALQEAALHAKRHDRVLASRSRIAAKARRDAQLREEARNRVFKNAQWFADLARSQKKSEQQATLDNRKQLEAARSRTGGAGWFAAAKEKVGAFLRRRP